MPAAPRRSSAPAGKEALRIDVEVLRYLVSRPGLAKALWNRGQREMTQTVLHNTYGDDGVLSVKVSRTALSTAVSAIDDAFNVDADTLDPQDAPLVVDMVELALSLDVQLSEEIQLVLMIALMHGALELLAFVRRANQKAVYRRVLDLVRDEGWTSKLKTRVEKMATDAIKAVAAALYRLEEFTNHSNRVKAARRAARVVYKRYPISWIQPRITRFARDLERNSAPLWVHQMHHLHKRTPRDQPHANGIAERNCTKLVPDFFSDDEYDMRNLRVTQFTRNEPDSNKGTLHAFSPMQANESDVCPDKAPEKSEESESEAINEESHKESPRKRRRSVVADGASKRRLRQKSRDSNSEGEENETGYMNLRSNRSPKEKSEAPIGSDMEDSNPEESHNSDDEDPTYSVPEADNAQPRKRLEDEKCDDEALIDGVNSISSNLFNAVNPGDDASRDGLVTRHSQKRRSTRKENRSKQRGSRSPTVVDKDDLDRDKEQQRSPMETDSDDDECSRAQIPGREGEVLRDLHEATVRSRRSGIPDPLEESVRDAKTAKRQTRRSSRLSYSPNVNGRAASPIPDSGVLIERKRRRRRDLHADNESEEEDLEEEKTRRPRRPFRTGRFQIYEDELLVEGLTKYGWGMWRQISDDFGGGKFTRAPMSLKDRARTMNLNPARYPIPPDCDIIKRGRPRVRPFADAKNSESDSIEAPDSSPADGPQDE